MVDEALAKSVITAACAMHKDGLTVANSGNVSVRDGDGFLITPSGVPYEDLNSADIVNLDFQCEKILVTFEPSRELKIH